MKDKIAKSLFWVVWSRGGGQIVSFLCTLLIARWLDPTDYGIMALVAMATGPLAMVTDMGLGGVLIQFKDLRDSELNVFFWLRLTTAILSYAAVFLAAPALADWFDSPRLSDALRVAGLTLLFPPLQFVPDAMLRKQLMFDQLAQAEIVTGAITLPLMLLMAWGGAGLWALLVPPLIGAGMYTAWVLMAFPWWPGWSLKTDRIPAMLRYGMAGVGTNAGWYVFAQLDVLIIGKLLGEQSLGLYSMGKQLALLPVTKISVVINQLMFPVLAQWQDDDLRLQKVFLKVLRVVACGTLPLSVGMGFLAPDLVAVVLRPQWAPIVPLFQVFACFAAVHSLEVLLPPVLAARYLLGFQFRWTLALLVVMPLPFILAARQMGATGVALTWITVYPLLAAFMARKVLSELRIPAIAALKEIGPTLTAVAAMAASLLVVLSGLPQVAWADHVIRLLVGTTVGILIYAAVMLWQGGVLVREVVEVAGWIVRRHQHA